MPARYRLTVTIVWLVLCALTGYSLFMRSGTRAGDLNISGYAFSVILLVAFIKARMVILHFMEVGHAPWALRAIFEAWVVAAFLGLTVLFNWAKIAS
jgi:hypothetical protein